MANLFRWCFRQPRVASRPRSRQTARPFRLELESLEQRWLPSTVTVTTAADVLDAPNTSSIAALLANPGPDGKISLREAITACDNDPSGPNVINFNMASSGVQTINVAGGLPSITTNALTIDGTTELGYSSANGMPVVVLNGSGAGSGADGLVVFVANCTIKGLAIDNFQFAGIYVYASNTTVVDNYLGIDATGTTAAGNYYGMYLSPFSGSTTIGGTNGVATRNIISGNLGDGVEGAGSGNDIVGNYIGTDLNGTSAKPNGGNGIFDVGMNTAIGGLSSGANNIISDNSGNGISLQGTSAMVVGNTIQSNGLAGVEDNGSKGNTFTFNAISNNKGDGVLVTNGATIGLVQYNTIQSNGGQGIEVNQASGAGQPISTNTITGNTANGIYLHNGATKIVVQTNTIEQNVQNGVELYNAPSNSIGGTASGAGNVISGNLQNGVLLLGSGTSGNTLNANYIGTTSGGTAKLANSGNGVYLNNAPNNVVGGTAVGAGNVISGNNQNGILLAGGNATSNQVDGNFIGTDASGGKKIGNALQGIYISSASYNTIGTTGGQNVISGNGANGVEIAGSGAHGNTVADDLIGTDINGGTALGNTSNGVLVSGAPSNTFTGDVISGNGQSGVVVVGSAASGNLVYSNLIGTDPSGGTGVGNGTYGVYLSNAPGNTVGGSYGQNVISANQHGGVVIAGPSASANLVAANAIGTDVSGTMPLSNLGDGVLLEGPNNTIQGNTLSGNTNYGLEIAGTYASGNLVEGNHIGTDTGGTIALPNSAFGVVVESAGNTIGGASGGNGNLISGNKAGGVYLGGSQATGNSVAGNYIGTDATGTTALPNGVGDGVRVSGNSNTIGGSTAASGNLISGNGANGVNLTGNNNLVLENNIGTDVSGEAVLANSSGVSISGSNNRLGAFLSGSTTVTAGNLISGNTNYGIAIQGSAATSNWVAANRIGTDANVTKKLGNGTGVYLQAAGNTIGGTTSGAGNIIAGSTNYAIYLNGAAATGNLVQGNDIGTDATGTVNLGNARGVVIVAASNNTIGGTVAGAGNMIANNTSYGVYVASGTGDGILENSLYSNGYEITLGSGANNNQAAPVLASPTTRNPDGTLTVTGTLTSTANTTFRIEFFASPVAGQAKTFLGFVTVMTDGTGHANINSGELAGVASGQLVTATATDPKNDTSVLSNSVTAA